jgi:hypothetical protein
MERTIVLGLNSNSKVKDAQEEYVLLLKLSKRKLRQLRDFGVILRAGLLEKYLLLEKT